MRSHVIGWLAVPVLAAGMALAIPAFSTPAFAQTAPPTTAPADQPAAGIPSVGVIPVGTKPDDPNGGQWFVMTLSPGESGTAQARIANPADIPQTVRVYLADLDFSTDGTPNVANASSDVGTWGKTGLGELTIPPKTSATVPFTVTVPNNADPGDHVGALVVEGQPRSNGPNTAFKVVTRVATRLYVTVPGDAKADFAIAKVTPSKDSSLFTKEITTTVVLHNTGRIRLHPTVKVNGKIATGPATLLSHSVEKYTATQKVPMWGGPVSSKVEVTTTVDRVGRQEAGPIRSAKSSTFVIPYVLMIGIALLVGLYLLVRWLWRKRGGKYAAIQADLARFERLFEQQRAAGEVTTDTTHEAELAIKSAIKQAGRSGDKDTEIKLREKLAELREQEAASPPPTSAPAPAPQSPAPAAAASNPQPASVVAVPPVTASAASAGNGNGNGDGNGNDAALVAILRALAVAPPGGQRFSLIKAARHCGRAAIEARPEELAALPDDVRIRLLRGAPLSASQARSPDQGNGGGRDGSAPSPSGYR